MSKYTIDNPTYQEFLILATGFNSLGSGEPGRVADLLVQRWKALEAKLSGQGAAASSLELVDADGRGILGRQELREAQRDQVGFQRLQDAGSRRH